MNATEKQITKRVEEAIADEVFPGCVIGFITPQDREVLSFGYHTYEKEISVKKDTVYDAASITKAACPHSVLLMLIDQGRIDLEDKVADYLPQFDTSDWKRTAKIKHLLTYTLDIFIPENKYFRRAPTDQVLQSIMKAELDSPPGSSFRYTKVTTILMTYIIESVLSERLDNICASKFFSPLDMHKTTFHPEEKLTDQAIPPTEIRPETGKVVCGEVHDEDTNLLQAQGYYFGAAGLFTMVPDLLRFLSMLLNKGSQSGHRYFSEKILDNAFSSHFVGRKQIMGLGWALADKRHAGDGANKSVFTSVGFTGCLLAGNYQKNAGVVLLSNRTYPKRPEEPDKINNLRQDIADIVWQSVDKK